MFILFSVIIAFMDIKTGLIPRIAFITAFIMFIILKVVSSSILWLSITGAFIGLCVFSLAYFITKKKLGLADVWYSSLTGFVLEPLWWYAATSIACVLGIFFILIFKKQKVPFIPFMAAGGVAVSMVRV